MSKKVNKIVVLVGFAFSLALVFHFFFGSSLGNDSTLLTANVNAFYEQEKMVGLPVPLVDKPMRLKILSINVDATIESVGMTPDGAMDVPKKSDEVAWFNLGTRPGKIGSAVIAGHSGYKDNRQAVFDNLSKLKKKDKIYIEDEKGKTITFVVQGFRTYAPGEDASSVFSSSDDKMRLNLITCFGTWDNVERTHSSRLVVFTEKE